MYHAPESSDEKDEKHVEIKGMKKIYQVIEKRLRAIEGGKVFGVVTKEICLVFGLMIPEKFKTPDFNKYKAHSCPKSHLIMYCRKMATHVEDDKLMMHYFQDNLKGVSSKWYLSLEQIHI